jgi:hypothetical protein
MQKDILDSYDFFPFWDFNNTKFYLNLPSLKENEKKELVEKIVEFNGVSIILML